MKDKKNNYYNKDSRGYSKDNRGDRTAPKQRANRGGSAAR